MSQTATISAITGTSDFDIWVSNACSGNTTTIYIDTISNSDLPYTFTIPQTFQNSGFCIKIIDDNNCETCECFGIS